MAFLIFLLLTTQQGIPIGVVPFSSQNEGEYPSGYQTTTNLQKAKKIAAQGSEILKQGHGLLTQAPDTLVDALSESVAKDGVKLLVKVAKNMNGNSI
jgi:hypothetical protein